MASLPNSTLFLTITVLTLLALQTKPAHSLTCTSQTLSNNKLYANCTDLPTLSSYLHYTYNSTNTSLSVAFVGSPSKPNGWVAWAINPVSTGMAGAQAFISFKVNGSLTVKTYDIVSYSNLTESKLSFDVWDVSAVSNTTSGDFTIFASVKVPGGSLEKLNYIWQVGPSVTNGRPDKHNFAAANLNSKATLVLAAASAQTPLTAAAAPSPHRTAVAPSSPTTTSTAAPPSNGKSAGSRCGLNYLGFVGASVILGALVGF